MDEEIGVGPLVAVSYTLRHPPNVIRKCRSPGDFIVAAYQLRVPLSFSPVAGSSTHWKVIAPSPTVSTVWMARLSERRTYLLGGLRARGSNFGGGTRGILCGRHGDTVGGTLRGAWESALPCSGGSCIFAQVRLGGGVCVGVGAPVAEKKSANYWIASMVWVPKLAKDAMSAGLERASARRLTASVAVLVEDKAGKAPFLGKTVIFWLCNFLVSPECKCSSIGSGVGLC